MKHKFFSLSVVAIALITSSCSNDIDEGQAPGAYSGGQAITFEPWAIKQTKAAATQAGDMKDFAVLATDTAAADVLIDGALVSRTGSTWTYSPKAFWPETATVNFFAFSPTDAVNVAGGAAALVGQNDKNANEPTIEYTLPALLSDQKDLLVARHSGAYTQDGTTGVRLNFRHALSRVLFQAKSESATPFEVLSIKLMNVKSKATLYLNNVPKDAVVFPYPKNNDEINTTGYQTFWEPDNPATPTVVDLEAKLTLDSVPGDGAWHYIVGDADALYVIPQENAASSMDSATVVDASFTPLNEFYIEIAYQEIVEAGQPVQPPKTYAVPVPAIVGDAYASSIAFEMERQYTFQFELTGRKTIDFKGVTVSNYSNVTQVEPLSLKWAGSNIYWDGTKLTFDDDSIKTNEARQGVLFKWGSLVGISPEGADASGWTGRTYYPTNPGIDATWTTNTSYSDFTKIPYASAPLTSNEWNRDNAYLTEITNIPDTVAALKGDICVYLTNIGAAPKGKRWRMPTSAEFGDSAKYTLNPATGGFGSIIGAANGQSTISSGYRKVDLNHPYLPASGARNYVAGALFNVGTSGYYWSSSSSSATNGYSIYFTRTTMNPVSNTNRQYGYSVRCVAE